MMNFPLFLLVAQEHAIFKNLLQKYKGVTNDRAKLLWMLFVTAGISQKDLKDDEKYEGLSM